MLQGKAIIIVGINRSGTSAIAASLNELGVFLGDQCPKPTFEDVSLSQSFRNKDWKAFEKIVTDYSSRHDIYAWKLPDAIHHLKKVDKLFKNKKFIFVFRDIYAIALRKEKTLSQDVFDNMIKSNLIYRDTLRFIQRQNLEYIAVSYEKMLTNPREYADNLLSFTNLEKSEENINKVINTISVSPKEYNIWANKIKQKVSLDKHDIAGHLDFAGNLEVSGWAKSAHSETPLSLTVLVDNIEVLTFKANSHRADLISAGVSTTGNHAFKVKLPQPVGSGCKISVIEKSSGTNLIGSPVTIKPHV